MRGGVVEGRRFFGGSLDWFRFRGFLEVGGVGFYKLGV